VLNADVPNCYITLLQLLVLHCSHLHHRYDRGRLVIYEFRDIKYSMLKIADNKIADADELRTRLIDEWAQFDQSIVDAAISQWRRRLCACVRVRGAH